MQSDGIDDDEEQRAEMMRSLTGAEPTSRYAKRRKLIREAGVGSAESLFAGKLDEG